MTTKTQRQQEQIYYHGVKLKDVFSIPCEGLPAKKLATAVHRLEHEMHRMAERWCNGEVDEATCNRKEVSVLKRLDALLSFKRLGIPVIINLDPRGYALKIDDEYVRTHNLDIHRDWGGYGILAPEFEGSK